MNAQNRFIAIGLSYLLIIGVAGLISAFSVQQSMAVTIIGNESLSVDPVDAKVFDVKNMYPGNTVSSDITIKNEGVESFSLNISLAVIDGGQELIDSLKITVFDQGADPETNYYYSGKIADLGTQFIGDVPANSSQVLVFTLTFMPGQGNVTQNQYADMSWVFQAGGALGGNGENGTGPVGPIGPGDFNVFNVSSPGITPEGEGVVPPEGPIVVLTAAPAEDGLEDAADDEVAPVEELAVAPEEPQVEPVDEVLGIFSYWPYWLLLLLLPLLFLFFFVRRVLVMVPGEQVDFKVVARRFAWRRDKKWFVNIEKQLDRYLSEHGLVVVDFRGGLIKRASKSVYAGKSILGAGSLRYGLIGSHRMVTWAVELKNQHSRQVG